MSAPYNLFHPSLLIHNRQASWREWLTQGGAAAMAAFGIPFLVYIATLAPTIYNLDSAELTIAAATGGIVRATGYPLYLILGRLWASLPVGDVGYRLNLFSAFCGALTILLADRILRRWQVGGWARFGALGLLATAPYFWVLSLAAEVYTLHTALMAGIILTWLRWAEQATPGRLAVAVFVLSVSFGNHAATILLVPGVVWFALTAAPRALLHPRALAAAGLGALLGAAVFLYIPWRYSAEPAFNYAGQYAASGAFQPVNLRSWEGLVWLLTGRAFAGQMFGYRWAELGGQVAAYGAQLWRASLAIGFGPGLLGAWQLARRHKRQAGLVGLMFLVNAIFYINYRVVDKNTMFLPTYLVWALWVGVGYQTLLQWVTPAPGWAVTLLRSCVVGAAMVALVWTWGQVDLSADTSTRDQSQAILDMVAPNAIVLGWWDTVPGLQYLQLVEGQRPDVLAINRFLISGAAMQTLIAQQAGMRPIYINSPPLYTIQTMTVTQEGGLYRLEPRSRP